MIHKASGSILYLLISKQSQARSDDSTQILIKALEDKIPDQQGSENKTPDPQGTEKKTPQLNRRLEKEQRELKKREMKQLKRGTVKKPPN